MHIRCKRCHGSIWVEPNDSPEPSRWIRCKSCAQDYSIEGSAKLRSGARRLATDARKIAEAHGIDLPGAYSVLFGIMTPEEVLELGDGGSSADLTSDPDTTEASDASYDEAFQPAIDAGHMSSFEATRRGQRAALAESIVRRHDIRLDVALDIADNKTSLLNCLRQRRNDQRAEIVASVPRGPGRYLGWTAAALVALSASLLITYASPEPSPAVVRTVKVQDAEVRIDDRGQVLRVTGTNPRTVLNGFCATSRGSEAMEAVGVVPSRHGMRDSRLGLLRERDDKNNVFTIEILENRAVGRWIAGDGISPIVPKSVPYGVLVEQRPSRSP